jgi:hypothetical protein
MSVGRCRGALGALVANTAALIQIGAAAMPKARRPWLLKSGKPQRIGKIQNRIRRAFVANNGRPLKIRELLDHCYPRTSKPPRWCRWSIHKALPKFGVPLGRIPTQQGRPMLWAPNADLIRLIHPK